MIPTVTGTHRVVANLMEMARVDVHTHTNYDHRCEFRIVLPIVLGTGGTASG